MTKNIIKEISQKRNTIEREYTFRYSPTLGKKVKRKNFSDCSILAGIFSVVKLGAYKGHVVFSNRKKAVEMLNTFDNIQYNGYNGQEKTGFCAECVDTINKNEIYFKRGYWHLKEEIYNK